MLDTALFLSGWEGESAGCLICQSLLLICHSFLRTRADAFATLYTFVVVYSRVAVAPLGDCSYRAQFYEGTHMVMRAKIFVQNYHMISC